MVDVGTQDLALFVERVEAVALREEVLERTWLGREPQPVGPVSSDSSAGGPSLDTRLVW